MKSLKDIVFRNLRKLYIVMVLSVFLIAMLLQVLLLQKQARENAQATFLQIGQILQQNQEELASIEGEYRETCLLNAETIAYIIQHHPEILGNVPEFRQLAEMMQVDEIHIFDNTGRIFTGTHPEYFDFTFDSGEQMNFFKPMLQNKTLELCQDITPNTAEGKLVQYSALWSADGQFIVQVGMYPDKVLAVTEKNELSYIFSLLQGQPGVDFYAIHAATGEIIGATTVSDNGKSMAQLGFAMADVGQYQRGAHVTVRGVDSYCVFEDMDGTLLAYVIATDALYSNIPLYLCVLVAGLILIALVFVYGVRMFINHYIIDSIYSTNQKLREVTAGNLEGQVDVQSSLEFSELSSHINDMIRSLLASTDKMSFVLNHTNMRIGVYEYNQKMKTVRFTENIPKILDLDESELHRLSSDVRKMRGYIENLHRNPVPGEKNVYQVSGKREAYVKLEEITSGGDTLGIIMDVTEETLIRRRIEAERDIDPLTGLYNRRGLEQQLDRILEAYRDCGYGALVMIDSDGLKNINDAYGHAVGDQYIQCVAKEIQSFGSAKRLVARLGGDEFVLLLYGYETEEPLREDIEQLCAIQKGMNLTLADGSQMPVRFSYGYVLTKGRRDYQAMISEADIHMYEVKRKRKRALERL